MAIAGIFRFGEPRSVERDLELMAAGLAPYGGDRLDSWCARSVGMVSNSDSRASHRAPGDATAARDGGRYVAVCDARIDNRGEVAGRLGLSADEAVATSDNEIVRRAFATWETRLPAYVDGAFAIAVWDPDRNRLHCFRDHAGQRPLFYYRSEALFAFATMPTGLLALDDVPCRLDELKMAEILLGCHVRTERSPFEGIHRLAGGSRLEAGPGSQRVTRYWSVAECPRVECASDADYATKARSLLLSSAASKLPGSRGVGASLSGGLDSSSVVCAAARKLQPEQRDIVAFHRAPPRNFGRRPPSTKLLHEARFVEAIARRYQNVEVDHVQEGAASYLDGLAERTRYCQRPVLRVANHHWFHTLWGAARDRGVGVLLVGGAGDLTLSWGGQGELAELARRGRWGKLARLVPRRAAWLDIPRSRVLRSHVVAPMVRELQFRASALFSPGRSLRHAAAQSPIRRELIDELGLEAWLRELGWETGTPRLLQQRELRIRQAIAYDDAVGEVHSGLEAMYGFEFRDPFRDRSVLEFAFGVPPLQYLADGADRSLLRRAGVGMVPESILERRKKGAQAVDWAERLIESREEVREEIARISRSSLASRILDVPRMSSILEEDRLSTWIEAQDADTLIDPGGTYRSLMLDYNEVLLKGISVGMFLRWVEEGAPPMPRATRPADR